MTIGWTYAPSQGVAMVLLDSVAEVLLIEDRPADVRLIIEALRESLVPVHLSVAPDGNEALAFLRREGSHAAAPQPDLILLDLDLPGKNGREVLREIKADAALCSRPLVVLSGSREATDIMLSYRLHANAYVTKPIQFERLVLDMRSILNFWFDIATRPPKL